MQALPPTPNSHKLLSSCATGSQGKKLGFLDGTTKLQWQSCVFQEPCFGKPFRFEKILLAEFIKKIS